MKERNKDSFHSFISLVFFSIEYGFALVRIYQWISCIATFVSNVFSMCALGVRCVFVPLVSAFKSMKSFSFLSFLMIFVCFRRAFRARIVLCVYLLSYFPRYFFSFSSARQRNHIIFLAHCL